jgi:hypothetical protein
VEIIVQPALLLAILAAPNARVPSTEVQQQFAQLVTLNAQLLVAMVQILTQAALLVILDIIYQVPLASNVIELV